MRSALIAPVLIAAAAFAQPKLRPPAVPLVAHDPYFSVWSAADRLTDEPTKHWTGTEQQLAGLLRIDGVPFRFMGALPREARAMKQTDLSLTPTSTRYTFEAGGVRLVFTFLTPALIADLDLLSRPLTYLVAEVAAMDGKPHQVSLYIDASAWLATNTPEQRVALSRFRVGAIDALRAGTTDQQALVRSGDNLRIDWGYVYLAVPPQPGASTLLTSLRARGEFAASGRLGEADEIDIPQASRYHPVLAAAFDLGAVGPQPVSRHLMLAYDDLFSIQYFHRNLRPWWRRKGDTAADLLRAGARDFAALAERSRRFDEAFTADLARAGGPEYAEIAVLAYRQAIAAHKLAADIDGSPIYFSKENFSNGCIGTVDVFYPAAPLFLLLSPELIKAQMTPIFEYARIGRWPWPYAPHDLGQYPLANGQVYGGGEKSEDRQMPVEESGNMLILTAALAKIEGHAEYARKYWPQIKRWADYLREKGMDPDNQLSTDDFAGHLAHNANLSIKAIVALGGYAQLAQALGETAEAARYKSIAQQMARKWPGMAADGDHYRLAFDAPNTWSQKYNLVWDRLLGLNLFAPEIARKEIAFYKTKQNAYGLPLDNRQTYTKLDWIVWTATMAESQDDFLALIRPVHKFLNESPSRVPMTDWYWTLDGKQRGFQARSVVGGVFIKMLADEGLWRKWAQSPPAR
jgi:hypothetical protein